MTDEVIGRGVIEVSADSSKLNAAINDARRSINSLGEAAGTASKRQSASINQYVKDLQTAAAVQGKSAREAELYKLALRGASDEQLRGANSALKLSEAYERGLSIGDKVRTGVLALGAATVAAGVGAAALANHLANQIADYQQISEKIGDTASSVASLQQAADVSGTSLNTVSQFSIKLTDNLSKTNDESKLTGRALAAIGLDFKTFKTAGPVQQLDLLAKALANFKDGDQGKTAVLDAIAKGGAQLLPFLNDLNAAGERQLTLTDAQIARADEFTKAQARQASQMRLIGQVIVAESLPAVIDLTGAIKDAIEQTTGLGKAGGDLKSNHGIADFAEDSAKSLARLVDVAAITGTAIGAVGRTIGGVVAAFGSFLKGDFKLAGNIISETLADIRNTKAPASIADALDKRIADRRAKEQAGGTGAGTDGKPKINTDGLSRDKIKTGRSAAEREAEQVRRAELEADLKFLHDKLGEERDTIAFHQRELSALYQAGSISLREFYDQRNKEIADGVQRELNLLTDEQARLEVELDAVKDPSDRIRLQTKLDEAIEKSSKVAVDAARAARLSNLEEAESFKQLSEQVQGFKATLLAAQGDQAGAASIRTAEAIRQVRELAERAKGSANPISDAQVNAQIAALKQADALNLLKTRTSEINQRLAIEEDRIALAQKTGATTELGALAAIGDARSKIVGEMEQQVAELERIAKERPLDIQLNIDASRARLELDKFKADLDPLKEKFDNMFKGAGTNALADLFNGKTTPLGAIKAFGAQIATELNTTIAAEISQTAFGKGGIFGEAGGLLSGLFPGGKKGADPTRPSIDTSAVTASFSSLQSAGIDPAISALARLAQQADTTASSVGRTPGGDPSSITTTGDFARFDRTQSGEASIADLFKPVDESQALAANSAEQFSKSSAAAAIDVARLAASASSGSGALSLLPQIIGAIASASAASAAGSGGGGGGSIWGTLFSAAASYFTGGSNLSIDTSGYSANAGIGYASAAGISGGRAGGGALSPNRIHPVNETGRPEMLTTRGGQQYLMPVPQGGTVSPATDGWQRPVEQHFHFQDSKPTRDTLAQVSAKASRGLALGKRIS